MIYAIPPRVHSFQCYSVSILCKAMQFQCCSNQFLCSAVQFNSASYLFGAIPWLVVSELVHAIPVHVGSLPCVAIPSLVNAIQFRRFAFQSISLAMNRVAFPVPIGASLSYSDTFLCYANSLLFASTRVYAIPVRFGAIQSNSFASTFRASPIRCRSQLLRRGSVHRISAAGPCSSVSIRFVASQFRCAASQPMQFRSMVRSVQNRSPGVTPRMSAAFRRLSSVGCVSPDSHWAIAACEILSAEASSLWERPAFSRKIRIFSNLPSPFYKIISVSY